MQGLETRDHYAQQLDHDGCGDVRHHTECEDRQLQHGATGEQVHQTDEVLGVAAHLRHAVVDDGFVDAWRRNIRADSVNDDHAKDKEDFVPQLLGPKGLDKCPHLGFPPIIN